MEGRIRDDISEPVSHLWRHLFLGLDSPTGGLWCLYWKHLDITGKLIALIKKTGFQENKATNIKAGKGTNNIGPT